MYIPLRCAWAQSTDVREFCLVVSIGVALAHSSPYSLSHGYIRMASPSVPSHHTWPESNCSMQILPHGFWEHTDLCQLLYIVIPSPGFKHCPPYGVSMPNNEAHTQCLLCLGKEHIREKCSICCSFKKRIQPMRPPDMPLVSDFSPWKERDHSPSFGRSKKIPQKTNWSHFRAQRDSSSCCRKS